MTKKILLYLLLGFFINGKIAAMNISGEEEYRKIRPLFTTPPKGMFWTQGENGNAILKTKPSIVDISKLQSKTTTIKKEEPIISTQESSFEGAEDEMLEEFLHMQYAKQKETWKQLINYEVDKKYSLKLKELNQELLNKDMEKIKHLLSQGVNISLIAETFEVTEEFVKSLVNK